MNIEIKAQGVYPKDTPPDRETILIWSDYYEEWAAISAGITPGDVWVQLSKPVKHEVDNEIARLVTTAQEAHIDVRDLLIHAIKEA